MLEFLDTKQVASILRLHYKTVARMIREGRLPASKIGKEWRINRSDLEAFVERNRRIAPQHS